jgi:SAM-dependent methyltransferase
MLRLVIAARSSNAALPAMSTSAAEFWDHVFEPGDRDAGSRIEMPDPRDPVLLRACEHFGELRGRTLIDVGCGRGATSLFFASRGAQVISVDRSPVAIKNLTDYCTRRKIANIRPVQISALELPRVGNADFVFGSMILHHLEPFDRFVEALRAVLRADGKAFFWENSARSALLIWFRQNVVGRLWVPKYGDPDEFPLTPSEVDLLRRHFAVHVEIPELVLFRLISLYLLRNRLRAPFAWADRIGYRFGWLRKYSYTQYIILG